MNSITPVNSYPQQQSVQSLIELAYIRTANEVLENALSGLEDAITVSKAIITTLNSLQQEKNKLVITAKGPLPAYNEGNYEELASAFFGSAIIPTIDPTFNPATVSSLKATLDAQLAQLNGLTGGSLLADPNSIYNTALQVSTDIGADPTFWLLDNYNQAQTPGASNAGKFQTNLTTAITAAQTLNDQQKEEVRRYLFVFEEYYKSAAALLSKITQILERIAQNIARG